MTNIQILFFCALTIVFIGVMFLLLWKVHKVETRIDGVEKKYEENINKLKDICTDIYGKLKEVVDRVNPLLADKMTDEEVFEAEFTDNESNGNTVEGE